MKIGIYGGTFSPPHFGHVRATRAFYRQMKLDTLYVVPTAIPPHKQMEGDADSVTRLNMARLAFDNLDGERIVVSDYETVKKTVSFTVETLEHFRAAVSEDIYLLCGTDMFLTLDKWKRAEDIFRYAKIVCASRTSEAAFIPQIEEKRALYEKTYGADVSLLDIIPFEISSSEVRAALAAGSDVSEYVPAAVIELIKENNLYGVCK